MKYLKKIGLLLTIISLVFITRYLINCWAEISALSLDRVISFNSISVIALIFIPIFAIFVLIWQFLLQGNRIFLPYMAAFRILSISNINKYLPGNVFQFASRAILAREYGVPLSICTISMAQEAFLLILCGSIIGCAGFLLSGNSPVQLEILLFMIVAGLIVLHPRILWAIIRFMLNCLGKEIPLSNTPFNYRYLFFAFFLTFVVFILWGFVLFILLLALIPAAKGLLMLSFFAFAISWIAGFITPGAPAGLGVREAVIIMLLGPSVDPATSLTAAGLLRLVTTIGELLFFVVGWLVVKNPASAPVTNKIK